MKRRVKKEPVFWTFSEFGDGEYKNWATIKLAVRRRRNGRISIDFRDYSGDATRRFYLSCDADNLRRKIFGGAG